MQEYVILVDEYNQSIGTADKLSTHNAHTPLHRGISVFLFNTSGKLLLQQRSSNKKTWPLIWSNSCCGHPLLGETSIDTARRRLKDELGITDSLLRVILPNYRYRFEKDGIYENEFCPVLVGNTKQIPKIATNEIAAVKWILWENWLKE